ncbi:precorrin-6A/cobalt-precorrin-6A reductase [Marinomonas epiphytica]
MKVLLLGGTADARKLAEGLIRSGVELIYSVAGLVRLPTLDCQLVVGGFTQFGGLEKYLLAQEITLILDVTHPYAQTMSSKAVQAGKAANVPCWRFHRPAWRPSDEENWLEYNNDDALLKRLVVARKPLLSAGQMSLELINAILVLPNIDSVVWRTAVAPKFELPTNVYWLKAIGPFGYEDEKTLFLTQGIDALVTKNSGGDATKAKLTVADELGVPIIIQSRPLLPEADKEFSDLDVCLHACMGLN